MATLHAPQFLQPLNEQNASPLFRRRANTREQDHAQVGGGGADGPNFGSSRFSDTQANQ